VAQILDVTDSTFADEVLQSEQPVLVDLWAEWCAPCRQLAPTLKQLADDYEGRVRIVKIDVDSNPEISAKLKVRAIPMLLLFTGGHLKGQIAGRSRSALSRAIDDLLA
jgi:thioredoxin 1